MLNIDQSGPPAPGYETRDANTSYILFFLLILLLVLAGTLFAMMLLFRHFSMVERYPAPVSSFAGVRQIPLGPDLQVHARRDLLNVSSSQERELDTYGWEDREAGTVRIPIDRAMDLLLQKGLPVRSSTLPGNDAASGTLAPAGHDASAKTPNSTRQPSNRGNN